LVFRYDAIAPTTTAPVEDPPAITPAERRLLIALCRPLLAGAAFPKPASVAEIAESLVLETSTVEWTLKQLMRKFAIDGPPGTRRVALANAALRRRAISIGDLRSPDA
jgi:hypothetical protein